MSMRAIVPPEASNGTHLLVIPLKIVHTHFDEGSEPVVQILICVESA